MSRILKSEQEALGSGGGNVQYVDAFINVAEDRGMENHGGSHLGPLMEHPGVEDQAERAMTAVGALVLQLRREANYSIGSLAAAAGLSPGLLSQIERGQGNPSLTTLIKLSQALKVPVGRFFDTKDQGGALVRRADRRRLKVAEDNLIYELLTPDMSGQLGMLRAQIAAGWDNEDAPFKHAGQECVTMIQGRLHVCINGVGYDLEEGDSLTYDSSLPHWYRNASSEDAVLIGAMTPPSF